MFTSPKENKNELIPFGERLSPTNFHVNLAFGIAARTRAPTTGQGYSPHGLDVGAHTVMSRAGGPRRADFFFSAPPGHRLKNSSAPEDAANDPLP